MLANDLVRQGQSQARAGLFGSKKGIEDPVETIIAYSASLIANVNRDLVSVLPRRQQHGPALRRCLNCVHDQIEQNLLQLLGVTLQAPQTRLNVLLQIPP